MRVELCHNPKAFTRDGVLAQLPGLRETMQRHGVRLAYLFGSALQETPHPLADLDIAVLPDPTTYDWLRTYTDLYDDLCSLFQADNIDVLLLNEAPLPFRFAVVRDGLLVWARDEREALAFAETTVAAYNDAAPWRREHWTWLCQRIEKGLSVAMRNVDPERVRFLLGRMDETIGQLKRLSIEDEAAFLDEGNWMTRDLAEHYIQKAIEAALDVGRHIILARGWQPPEEPRDVPRILRGHGVIDEPLSQKLTALASLRNLLIHRYGDVDPRRLYQVVTTELSTLDAYAQAVLHYVHREVTQQP